MVFAKQNKGDAIIQTARHPFVVTCQGTSKFNRNNLGGMTRYWPVWFCGIGKEGSAGWGKGLLRKAIVSIRKTIVPAS
jgi:hypothetical protein